MRNTARWCQLPEILPSVSRSSGYYSIITLCFSRTTGSGRLMGGVLVETRAYLQQQAATVSTFIAQNFETKKADCWWWKTEHKQRAGICRREHLNHLGILLLTPIALKVGFRLCPAQIFSLPDSSIGYLVTNLSAPTRALYAMFVL